MRRISPIGKRRAQGHQAAVSGVFLWAVQDGPDQSALQSALHVLVHPHMGRTVQIIERPGTELVYVWCRRLRASSWRAASAAFLVLVILYAFGTLVAGSSAAAAAFIPLAYTMIPDGGAFLLALLMNVSFASSQLGPTHICMAIISDYFGVTFFATVKKLLPLFLLTVLIACGYYMLLTAVF